MYFSEYNYVFPILVFINAINTEPVLERSTARVLYGNGNCLDRSILGSSWAFSKGVSDDF
jgi:hypothetical protein